MLYRLNVIFNITIILTKNICYGTMSSMQYTAPLVQITPITSHTTNGHVYIITKWKNTATPAIIHGNRGSQALQCRP